MIYRYTYTYPIRYPNLGPPGVVLEEQNRMVGKMEARGDGMDHDTGVSKHISHFWEDEPGIFPMVSRQQGMDHRGFWIG